jgi:hypothetical protein
MVKCKTRQEYALAPSQVKLQKFEYRWEEETCRMV